MANFKVDTNDDEAYGGGSLASETADGSGLSLREAIALANAAAGADTITFANGAGEAFENGGTLILAQGQLSLESDIVIDGDIDGDDKADIIIDADGNSRAFLAESGTSELASLTIQNGKAGRGRDGGGILVQDGAALTLLQSTLSDSRAGDGRNGANSFIYSGPYGEKLYQADAGSDGGAGGGVFVAAGGALSILNSTLTDNHAGDGGRGGNGADYRALGAFGPSKGARGGDGGLGGGVYLAGGAFLTISNGTFAGNTAGNGGAGGTGGGRSHGLAADGGRGGNGGGGGALHIGDDSATVALTNGSFTDNARGAKGAGGAGGDGGPSSNGADGSNGSGAIRVGSGGDGSGTGAMANTLVLGNTGGQVVDGGGFLTDGGGNLTTGNAADVFATGSLADNGGPVQTVALKADASNPALDRGTTALATDADGNARDVDLTAANSAGGDVDNGGTVDAGAVELQGIPEADSLIVTTTADTVNAFDGETSLREAIAFAISDGVASDITFANGAGEAFEFGGTIRLDDALGELVLSTELSIDGDLNNDGAADVTISGDSDGNDATTVDIAGNAITDVANNDGNESDNTRVFRVDSGQASLEGLVITGGVAEGAGAACNGGGVFVAQAGTLSLIDTHIGGNAAQSAGGGVFTQGSVTVTGGGFTGNEALTGGAIAVGSTGAAAVTLTGATLSGNSAGQFGGGIFNARTAILTNATLSGNDAGFGGGGIYNVGTATLTNATLSGNSAGGSGGGISNSGTATLTNSLVLGNSGGETSGGFTDNGGNITSGNKNAVFAAIDGATGGGQLADNGGPVQTIALKADASNAALDRGTTALATDADGNARDVDLAGADNGGTVDAGAVELQGIPEADSLIVTTTDDVVNEFDGETSLREAIAFANSDGVASAITFANGAGQAFENGGTITLDGAELVLTSDIIIDGDTDGDGEADVTVDADGRSRVFNIDNGADATLDALTVTGGNAGAGGGARVGFGAALTLTNVVVQGNHATGGGGGVYVGGASGGNPEGVLTMTGATIADNTSNVSGGGITSRGAIYLSDSTFVGNTALNVGGGLAIQNPPGAHLLENLTFVGNSSELRGGGVYTREDVTLTHVTITGNTAPSGSGLRADHADVTVENSIILGNSGAEISTNYASVNQINTISSGNASDVFAAIDGTTGGGALANNGGPVQTVALKADAANPALDVGDAPAGVTTDATGAAREVDQPLADNGGTVDAGAVELQADTIREADSLIVTTTADEVDAFDGETSLREAIAFANDTAGANTITFASGMGEAFENDALIRLTQGEIDITGALTIDGATAGGELVITGDANDDDAVVAGTDITDVAASFGGVAGDANDLLDDNSRIFNITGAKTTLDGLTLTGGRTTAEREKGGAVYSDAKLVVIDSVISGNSTTGDVSHGGGLFSVADISVTGSSISGNSTAGWIAEGGGLRSDGGSVTIIDSVISNNSTTGDTAKGGGARARTDLVIINSTVSGNSTSGDRASGGGAFSSEHISVTNSTISGNSTAGADARGGGLFASEDLALTNSIVMGNVTLNASDNQIRGDQTTLEGGNIVGGAFTIDGAAPASGAVTGLTAADVFAAVVDNNGVDAGALADNGWPVQTIALKADAANAALDAGDDLAAGVPATDARGEARFDQAGVANNGVNTSDLGAFELQGQAPVAEDDADTVAEDATVDIAVQANDQTAGLDIEQVDGQAISAGGSVTLASGARVTLNANGTLTYDPNDNFNTLISQAKATATGASNTSAEETFTYTLGDDPGDIGTVTVTITGVDSPDDRPEDTPGDDTFTGNENPDLFFIINGGSDTVTMGDSDDAVLFGATFDSTDKVDGGDGDLDQIGLQGDYSAGVTFGPEGAVDVEMIVLLPGDDTRFGAPGTESYSYDITLVDENIEPGERLIFQANTLKAGESFILDASAETDGSVFTYGGEGDEDLTGGQQDDAFFFGTGRFGPGDKVDGQGGDFDSIGLQGDYSGGITLGPDQVTDIEVLALLGNTDSRFGGAGSGDPYSYDITMDDGNVAAGEEMIVSANTLASDEIFTFDGSAETDGSFKIYSGNGDDVIRGSRNADVISGRGGADDLTGGMGDDAFLFTNDFDSTPAAADHIRDFTQGDIIDVRRLDAVEGGADDAFAFVGDAAFTATAGELRAVNTAGADWTIQGDVNGDGVADLEIMVTTTDANPIMEDDFLL